MKPIRSSSPVIAVLLLAFFCAQASAQQLQQAEPQIERVLNPPLFLSDGSGAMTLMSGPAPCDPCPDGGGGETNGVSCGGGWTTNAGLKFGPTPLVQGGIFSTWLQGVDTNSAYEIYEKFHLHTNLTWQRVAAGQLGQTNFAWWLPATNAAFYLAADSVDSDFDGLSDAFEQFRDVCNQ